VVVGGVPGVVEVVAQVAGEQDCHEVGGGHGGARVAGAGGGCRAHGVDAELLAELASQGGVVAGDLWLCLDASRALGRVNRAT
jgi:hypothetical protein